MNLTFSNIYNPGIIEKETNEFSHLAFMEVVDMYDGNFIKWKEMPTLETLKQVETYMKETHLARGQKHVKFVFPQDEKIPDVLVAYLTEQQYDLGTLEMYAVKPKTFSADVICSAKIQFVSEETLQAYSTIQYEEAKQWGESYALSKHEMLKKDFRDKRKQQIVAIIDGQVVGSTDVIVRDQTAEIDNLFVLPSFQRQGIGSKIQQFVMKHHEEKTIILVADGEDTPKDMYVKQGYRFIGFQYNALKTDIE
ncbi:GNAT family N-acetyltransferase [Solibacillus sp. R5-41]|uniref:GNAT family N-acetyltransferase n=1 Tax=Solibacillus sp. R5-41 TaxID=2048654 RepID=UPI000C127C37|nr:GNAT family N-acetyltransferase [Solibacillus sp. R5-41]ATP40584.1 GNAT family N-acetyltransferase [Solibacillus sp. R5-41]